MFDAYSFTQLTPTSRSLLSLMQLLQQFLIRMNRDAAPSSTIGTGICASQQRFAIA
jgi:hypothetical protein